MLIKIKGQTANLGQKQNDIIKQTVQVPIYDNLKALSDGSLYDVEALLYDDIPESANSMRDPFNGDDIL